MSIYEYDLFQYAEDIDKRSPPKSTDYPRIVLTSSEILMAVHCGGMRQLENVKKERQPRNGHDDMNNWHVHAEGCLGECALAKLTGHYWPGKGEFRGPDVGPSYYVKTTPWQKGHLILDDDDRNNLQQTWLMLGIYGTYRCAGWTLVGIAKEHKEWIHEEKIKGQIRKGWWVPQWFLEPYDPKRDNHGY